MIQFTGNPTMDAAITLELLDDDTTDSHSNTKQDKSDTIPNDANCNDGFVLGFVIFMTIVVFIICVKIMKD